MEPNQVDLKKTVHLPKTDFAMKANLPLREPEMLKRWEERGLYEQIRASRQGRPRYVLHDGPPYANGNIHLGHAFNKILKDFIVKTKTMAGFDSPYIPGWDCHGLPIEIKVDGELGKKKAGMTTAEIRAACRKYAQKYVDLQAADFQRLGVFGRWNDPYLTMTAGYEAVIAQAFVDFVDQGYVYKGLKPVNWCLNCRTSLAEAEVEYENHTSPSIWVRFALTSDAGAIDERLKGWRTYGMIWTTTPWTMPANLAISFHPKFEYSAVAVSPEARPASEAKDVYIIATDLVKQTAEAAGWPEYSVIATFPGEKLEGAVFKHPFLDRDSKGLIGDHVTLEQGTGAVHTAPGHGHEDYVIGLKYGLPVYCPVDGAGRLYQVGGVPGDLPESLLGLTVWEANSAVIGLLREYGALVAQKDLHHSYPHCWRCHKPTIFRGTEQWFISMEAHDLRTRTLEAIKGVKWHPAWGEDRISNMIATRPDWNISRQRVWGVPITAFYCESCTEPFTEKKFLDRVVERFRTETADAWYIHSAEVLLGEGAVCKKCNGASFRKEMDILDVWFDSGASHLAVLEPNGLGWPSNMYLEGGDQYRGWFHSSILIGVGLRGGSPYREIVTSGWTLDEQGRAMSKSLGNTIEPEKVIKQYGADVLRLWVASVEYNDDVRLSDTILRRLAEAYRKIRNTLRYALGAIGDFDPAAHADVPLLEIDQWILTRTQALAERTRANYEAYRFHWAYQDLYTFCGNELSAVYFDVSKDRLYTAATNSPERRGAQKAMYQVIQALVRLLAPILAFTTEEAWTFLRREGEPESVHVLEFPEPATLAGLTPELAAKWDQLLAVREQVTKSLEVARQEKLIGAPLEARVHLKAGPELLPLLEDYAADLAGLFIVSEVTLEGRSDADLSVHVDRATGTKCERCWKCKSDLGSDERFPTICVSCTKAVTSMIAAGEIATI